MSKKQKNEDELKKEIARLKSQLDEEKASKLMALADFQNFKKRLENEKNDYRIFATKLITGQLMQIKDDFERGEKDISEKLKGLPAEKDVQSSLQMLIDKIGMIILQNGYEEIEIKVGDSFNPEFMEALSTLPAKSEDENNKVVHVDQKAYKHIESGIIFKTAKVVISKFNK